MREYTNGTLPTPIEVELNILKAFSKIWFRRFNAIAAAVVA